MIPNVANIVRNAALTPTRSHVPAASSGSLKNDDASFLPGRDRQTVAKMSPKLRWNPENGGELPKTRR